MAISLLDATLELVSMQPPASKAPPDAASYGALSRGTFGRLFSFSHATVVRSHARASRHGGFSMNARSVPVGGRFFSDVNASSSWCKHACFCACNSSLPLFFISFFLFSFSISFFIYFNENQTTVIYLFSHHFFFPPLYCSVSCWVFVATY